MKEDKKTKVKGGDTIAGYISHDDNETSIIGRIVTVKRGRKKFKARVLSATDLEIIPPLWKRILNSILFNK